MSEKAEIYEQAAKEIAAVLDGERNVISRMATVSCLLSQAFDSYFWAGFYLVDLEKPHELVIGPYQGTLGCLRIPFGRGVCGAVAEQRQTVIVDDVHEFSDHIACDSRSVSEIVVPVIDADSNLIAVFDGKKKKKASFDETDKQYLEVIMKEVFAL